MIDGYSIVRGKEGSSEFLIFTIFLQMRISRTISLKLIPTSHDFSNRKLFS